MNLEKLKDTARKFEQKEDWRRAIEVYLKAIQQIESGQETSPDLSLYNRVGDLYLKTNDTAAAVRSYERAVDLGDGKSIQVRKVVVQAQPMGGYAALEDHFDEINQVIEQTGGALQRLRAVDDLDELAVLVVDPGEHTLDWLLIQQGSINPRASGAASDAGRHRVIRAVQDSLAADIGRPLGPAVAPRINEALRQQEPVKLSGVAHDLQKYEPQIMSVVEDSLNRMIDGLRDAHEIIDLIVLVGGHPGRYRDVLSRRFPSIPVFVAPESMSANVRGFQMIGEAMAEAA